MSNLVFSNKTNKKGQVMVVGVMLCVLAFLCALIFIPSIKESIDTARGSDYLDCSNTSITTGEAGTCLAVDLFLPFFIGTVIFVGIGYIGAKIMAGNA
jgi:hypothetical protein